VKHILLTVLIIVIGCCTVQADSTSVKINVTQARLDSVWQFAYDGQTLTRDLLWEIEAKLGRDSTHFPTLHKHIVEYVASITQERIRMYHLTNPSGGTVPDTLIVFDGPNPLMAGMIVGNYGGWIYISFKKIAYPNTPSTSNLRAK
jgi:hypothetical protein